MNLPVSCCCKYGVPNSYRSLARIYCFVLAFSTRSIDMGWKPPVEQYCIGDKETFAYESAVKRWPRILTQVVDELNQNFDSCSSTEALSEAKSYALRFLWRE